MTSIAELVSAIEIACEGLKPCTRPARYIVRLHALDRCATLAQLDPNGDRAYTLCETCLHAVVARAQESYVALIATQRHEQGPPRCFDCGRPFSSFCDLLSVEPIAFGATL